MWRIEWTCIRNAIPINHWSELATRKQIYVHVLHVRNHILLDILPFLAGFHLRNISEVKKKKKYYFKK
uniref:Uncharacterized protein n=1 Tax=Octopus bimaculoides TaxID=37653 RepID=A0A0L8GL24_OCTBM